MSEFRIIVGLGNPGKKYENTRHNLGSRVVRHIADRFNIKLKKSLGLRALVGKGQLDKKKFFLLLPLTYMNNSGGVIKRIIKRKGIASGNVLVVCDDIDLPFGRLRMRACGSDGAILRRRRTSTQLRSSSDLRTNGCARITTVCPAFWIGATRMRGSMVIAPATF